MDTSVTLGGNGATLLVRFDQGIAQEEKKTTTLATDNGITVEEAKRAIQNAAKRTDNTGDDAADPMLRQFVKIKQKKDLLLIGSHVRPLLFNFVAFMNTLHLMQQLRVSDVFFGDNIINIKLLTVVVNLSDSDSVLTMNVCEFLNDIIKPSLVDAEENQKQKAITLMLSLEKILNSDNATVGSAISNIEKYDLTSETNWPTVLASANGATKENSASEASGCFKTKYRSTETTYLERMLHIFFSHFLGGVMSTALGKTLALNNTLAFDMLFLNPCTHFEVFSAKYVKKVRLTNMTEARNNTWKKKLKQWAGERKKKVQKLNLLPTFVTSHNEERFEREKEAFKALVALKGIVENV